jgi:hypothetical protein
MTVVAATGGNIAAHAALHRGPTPQSQTMQIATPLR